MPDSDQRQILCRRPRSLQEGSSSTQQPTVIHHSLCGPAFLHPPVLSCATCLCRLTLLYRCTAPLHHAHITQVLLRVLDPACSVPPGEDAVQLERGLQKVPRQHLADEPRVRQGPALQRGLEEPDA